jgi:hypothetical protein
VRSQAPILGKDLGAGIFLTGLSDVPTEGGIFEEGSSARMFIHLDE